MVMAVDHRVKRVLNIVRTRDFFLLFFFFFIRVIDSVKHSGNPRLARGAPRPDLGRVWDRGLLPAGPLTVTTFAVNTGLGGGGKTQPPLSVVAINHPAFVFSY